MKERECVRESERKRGSEKRRERVGLRVFYQKILHYVYKEICVRKLTLLTADMIILLFPIAIP